jgi:hypothetical protein
LSRHRIIPAFIKIDVEGHERAVLEGGRQILYQHHPVLLVEAEERHTGKEGLEELFQFLKSLGYNGYFFFNGKKLPLSNFNPALHQNPDLIGKGGYSNNFVFEGK